MDLVEEVYRASAGFPAHEKYGLMGQIRRAAVSVPSNIAEGHTRASRREYLHHVTIAQASLAELETQLEIAARIEYLPKEKLASLLQTTDALGRQLNALRGALKERA